MGGDGLTYHWVIFPLIVALIEGQLGILLLPAFTAGGGGRTWCGCYNFSFPRLDSFLGFTGFGACGVKMGTGAG